MNHILREVLTCSQQRLCQCTRSVSTRPRKWRLPAPNPVPRVISPTGNRLGAVNSRSSNSVKDAKQNHNHYSSADSSLKRSIEKWRQLSPARTPPIQKSTEQLPLDSELPHWAVRKNAIRKRFPEGWSPVRKLSPDAMEGVRILYKQVIIPIS